MSKQKRFFTRKTREEPTNINNNQQTHILNVVKKCILNDSTTQRIHETNCVAASKNHERRPRFAIKHISLKNIYCTTFEDETVEGDQPNEDLLMEKQNGFVFNDKQNAMMKKKKKIG